MTHPLRKRPSVLLVGLAPTTERDLQSRLHAAGFDVVCTRSRAAAIVYGNELTPDFVLTDPTTSRILRGCYPDGPFWIRARLTDELDVLRGSATQPALLLRLCSAMPRASAAA